jgi:hypothetical protein
MQMTETMLVIGIFAALASGAALLGVRRVTSARPVMQPEQNGAERINGAEPGAVPNCGELLRSTLRRDLSLAAEHVHSIRWLLEIARQHNQPVPAAALTNLDLVLKHLSEMQHRVEAAGRVPEAGVMAAVNDRPIQSPLHP